MNVGDSIGAESVCYDVQCVMSPLERKIITPSPRPYAHNRLAIYKLKWVSKSLQNVWSK